MKKALSLILLFVAITMVFASCTPQKQTCAAYSNVELESEAQPN